MFKYGTLRLISGTAILDFSTTIQNDLIDIAKKELEKGEDIAKEELEKGEDKPIAKTIIIILFFKGDELVGILIIKTR